MPHFIPGLVLGEQFYHEAVKPILETDFPRLRYSAALIGSGSEILGFDTEMSTDHHWGPRVMLFLNEGDYESCATAIHEALRSKLPYSFRGYSTNFTAPNPQDRGTQLLHVIDQGPVNHRVEIFTIRDFLLDYLAFDIDQTIRPADWLTLPEQKLRTIVAGAVYHDECGLQAVREYFAYYPYDVWLYLLASSWTRIGQEEHLMGRAGIVGDELGSNLIGARLVRDLMRLCFLMEKQYAPYPKWFGTAFGKLACAPALAPILRQVQLAQTWQEREWHLVEAYEYVAHMHNALSITEPLSTSAEPFFGRPFLVIHADRFVEAIRARLGDPEIIRIAERRRIGNIDHLSDSTDLLSDGGWRSTLRQLYQT